MSFNSSSLLAILTTDSAEEYKCGVQPHLSRDLGVPNFLDKIQAVLAIITSTLAVLLNSLVVLLMYKYPSLRHHSLLLALPVTLIDLAKSILVTPIIFFSGTLLYNPVLCEITGYIHDGTVSLRLLLTGVISLDRAVATFIPRLYRRFHAGMSYSFFMIGLILSLLYVIGGMNDVVECYVYLPALKSCTIFLKCPGCLEYGYIWIGLSLTLGVILPAILFLLMFCKTRKQQEGSGLKDLKHTNCIMALLLVSISLSLPSTVLYLYQVNAGMASSAVYILQVIIGYPLCYLIPVIDGLALLCHKEIRAKAKHFFSRFQRHGGRDSAGQANPASEGRSGGDVAETSFSAQTRSREAERDLSAERVRVIMWHATPHTRLSPVPEVSEEGLSDTT